MEQVGSDKQVNLPILLLKGVPANAICSKGKKCCKNYKDGKRCKKCPKR